MATISSINRLFNVVDNALTSVNGDLGYSRLTDAIISLANAVHSYADSDSITDDGYELWHIGEHGLFTLDSLIVGAFWHFAHWHGGQYSKGYAALSALGQVFNPGMTTEEEENQAYIALNELAANQ